LTELTLCRSFRASTATANLISGGIDELFTRADSTGAFTPLKDALGSTIALVDANGNLQTTYSYDPFGNTTVSGTASSNPSQYTGRENEGNGLYYYRARYYSPLLGRFVNQDPLGFAGSGPNLYAYAGNDPVDFRDPSGLLGPGTVVAGAGTAATTAEVNAVAGTLVEGAATDMGLGAGFGTVVETGSAGGPAGLAIVGAGAAGWGTGRLVGHVPLIGGGTVDDGWQDIFTPLFSDPSPNPGAGPAFNPHPLAGRKDESSKELKSCKLDGQFELPSGQVACAYKCGHWPGAHITVTCDAGQKCKGDIPGGWVSKETACE
jgi:RHS repeat-associated protein